MKNIFTIIILFLVIVFLVVAGSITWVHYYYLPHVADIYQSTMSVGTTSAQDSTVPSPKTAAAMLGIEKLTKGYTPGYLDAVPLPRGLDSMPAMESSTFSYFGFTFSAPWADARKEKVLGNPPIMAEITFTNGRTVTLMKAETLSSSALAQYSSASSTIRTNYDWENAVLTATPDQVTNSTPGDEATLIFALLASKLLLLPPTPIYSFDTGVVKGFQHGDATTTRQTAINIFNQNDNEFDLLVSGTQDEIDYIVASMKLQPSKT